MLLSITVKKNSSDDLSNLLLDIPDQNAIEHIFYIKTLSKGLQSDSHIINIGLKKFLKDMRTFHNQFSMVSFYPRARNDNSQKA